MPDSPSSRSHLHEALLQVRYESEDFERGPDLPVDCGLDRCVILDQDPETLLKRFRTHVQRFNRLAYQIGQAG